MYCTKKAHLSACLIAGAILVGGTGVWAQDNQPMDGAPAGDSAAPSNTSATSSAPTAAAPAANPSGLPETVAPGPLEDARKILRSRIQQAHNEGIGTTNYNMAFSAIEDSIKSGQSEAQVKPRIESLARALKEQLDRGKILKTQHPLPAQGSQAADVPPGGAGGPDLSKIKEALAKPPGGGKADPSDILEKLKSKFGGSLPNIPDGLKDQFLNSDKGKELLKKLGQ